MEETNRPLDLTKFDKIFTLGPKGTFSNQAASLVGGTTIEDIHYTTTIPQIADAVEKSEHVLGVMPIENSIGGMVGQAQDALIQSNIVIVNELMLEIRFSLVSHVPLNEVKQFFSHTEAFNQTMIFTAKQMPDASVIFSNSNIHSGELFLERPDEPVAAIVPLIHAEINPNFKEKMLASNIQDYEQNMTRFVVIVKKADSYKPDFNRKKTSICIEFREDRHSLLFELLREFHVFGINLCRLESRPMKRTPWNYRFFIDLINNHRVETCLNELTKQNIGFKLFGSFDPIQNI